MGSASAVDPIWAPFEAVAAHVRAWPRIAQAFVGVTVLDILGRAIGTISPGLSFYPGNPVSWFTAFLPHDAWLLLPALLVLRRPDAETATPWVLRGAVLIAIVELLLSPTLSVMTNVLDLEQAIDATRWLAIVATWTKAIGWLAIGVGLSRLNPADPAGAIAGLANLGFWLVAGTVLFNLLALLVTPSNLSSGTIGGSVNPQAILFVASQLAFGYALRSVLRGLEDPSRSLWSTRVAAVGGLLAASVGFVGAVISTFAVAAFPFAIDLQVAISQALVLLAEVAGPSLIVAAFALGLADPLRPMAQDWEAAARA